MMVHIMRYVFLFIKYPSVYAGICNFSTFPKELQSPWRYAQYQADLLIVYPFSKYLILIHFCCIFYKRTKCLNLFKHPFKCRGFNIHNIHNPIFELFASKVTYNNIAIHLLSAKVMPFHLISIAGYPHRFFIETPIVNSVKPATLRFTLFTVFPLLP